MASTSHLYKGFATLVVLLIALQYMFGSVFEEFVNNAAAQWQENESNLRYTHLSTIRGHNLTKPRFYQGGQFTERIKNIDLINTSNILNQTNTTIFINNNISYTVINNTKDFDSFNKCPIIPPNLNGRVVLNTTYVPSVNELEHKFNWLQPGGHYEPVECQARYTVAILVPYRDRAEHLLIFLAHLHPFLKKQQLNYTIYLLEQAGRAPFNRAMLFNIGFREALKERAYDCFIFHDIDLLPEDDRNIYSCPEQPRHMSVAINVFNYKLPYGSIFGGVSVLTREQFETVNGYSNRFWGWGAEDDDMSNRVRFNNFTIARYPINIARYTMLTHRKEKASPKRYETLMDGKKRFRTEGLNNLKYRLKRKKHNLLYTWILVELKPPS